MTAYISCAGTVGRNFEGGDNAAKGREQLLAARSDHEV